MRLPACIRLVAIPGILLGCSGFVASAAEPIKAHPQNPYILEFRGKPTLLRAYAESYSSVIDAGQPFIPYLDVLKRDGMNLTRVWCLGFPTDNAASPEDFLQPWPRSSAGGNALDGFGKWDFSAWNEAFFDRLKAFAQAASDRGIVVEFTLFSTFYDLEPNWEAGPFHPLNNVQGYGPNNWNDTLRDVPGNQTLIAVQKAAVRRIVNELNGFDNIYFEIQNEPFWNEPGVKDDLEAAYQNLMLAEIRDEESSLPNRHMVAHNFPQQLGALSSDFDVINEHYPGPVAVPVTPIPGAEALLRDQYFRGRVLSLDETDTSTVEQTRLESWMFLIGGGGIYNGLDAKDYVYSPADPSGDTELGNAMRQAVRNIGSYMDQLYLVALRRDLTWVTGGIPTGARLQASASPDQQYVAYLHHGQTETKPFQLAYDPIDGSNHNVSLRVMLEPGDWRAVWTRPSDLVELHVQEFTHFGGEITLEQVSYGADVALRIDRTGPGDITPPPSPTGLAAVSNSDGSITLNWDTVTAPDLAAYHVYRSTAPNVSIDPSHRIAVVPKPETLHMDHPAVPSITYYYVVTAVDDQGNELAESYEIGAVSILPYPSPRLVVNPVGQRVLEWTTDYPGWTLQQSSNLSSWVLSSLKPLVTGNLYQVVIPSLAAPVFYRLAYIQPPPPDPTLRIFPDGGGMLVLEWPVEPSGWVLQESADLSPGSWMDSDLSASVAGDVYQVTFSPSAGSRFFRLSTQSIPPPAPVMPGLNLLAGGDGQFMLGWKVSASGWHLQESPDLSPGSWEDSVRSSTVVGDEHQVLITITPGVPQRFFRLIRP